MMAIYTESVLLLHFNWQCRQRGPASRTGSAAASKSSTKSSTATSTNIKSSTGSTASLPDVKSTSETLPVAHDDSDAPTDNAKQRELYSVFQRYIPNAPPAPSGDIKVSFMNKYSRLFPMQAAISRNFLRSLTFVKSAKGKDRRGRRGDGKVHFTSSRYFFTL